MFKIIDCFSVAHKDYNGLGKLDHRIREIRGTISHEKTFTPAKKVAVVLDAIKGQKTLNEISCEHEVHPTQIHEWKTGFLKPCHPSSRTSGRRTEKQKTVSSTICTSYWPARNRARVAEKKLHLDP